METSKSFNQEYIEKAKTLIHEILEDKKEYDDWTQNMFLDAKCSTSCG